MCEPRACVNKGSRGVKKGGAVCEPTHMCEQSTSLFVSAESAVCEQRSAPFVSK